MSVTKDDVRKVARLSRIAVDEAHLEELAGELNGILGWIDQLNEVDIDGVEPMTSVVETKLPMREDVVTDGNIPDQVLAKLNRYMDMGIRAFVLSGYPHLEECDLFAKYVLPKLNTCRLNELQGRLVRDPVTPLTTAPRS